MNVRSRRAVAILLFVLAVGGTIGVPLLMGGRAAFASVLELPLWGYVSIAALVSLNWLARTTKLLCLSRRLHVPATFWRMFAVSLATDFGFMVTPAGIGGYAACVHFLRRIGASTSGAVAITAADQLLDVVFFVLAVPAAAIALGWAVLPHIAFDALHVAIGIALTVVLPLAVWRGYRWALRGDRPCPAAWNRAARKLAEFATRARSDTRALFTSGALFTAQILALTVLQQCSRYGLLALIFDVLGYHVPLAVVFVLQTLVVQAAAWTGIPAGGGAAEIGLSASFAQWIPGTSLASALVVWRVATLHIGLVAGVVALVWLSTNTFDGERDRPASGKDAEADARVDD
jgi:uncharacterized protein (TIRG00374 family)